MRIGFVCEDFRNGGFGGGISAYTETLGKELIRRGHQVHIFSLGGTTRTFESNDGFVCHQVAWYRPRLVGWRTIYWGPLRRLWSGHVFNMSGAVPLGKAVLTMAQCGGLDVVEVPETDGRLRWHIRKIRQHVPVCVRLHAPCCITASTKGGVGQRFIAQVSIHESAMIEAASAISSPSQSLVDEVRQRLGCCRQRSVSIVPNPVERTRVDHVGRSAWDNPQLIFVGRLELLKGVDVLVRAFAEVCRHHPAVQLTLAGPDPDRWCVGGLANMVRRFLTAKESERILSRITWLGPVSRERADKLRAGAACVLLPSRYESFSMALAETMAVGAPFVASSAGAIPELVGQELGELLVKPQDVAGWAERILWVLEHPVRAMELAGLAKIRVQGCYAPEHIADQVLCGFAELGVQGSCP